MIKQDNLQLQTIDLPRATIPCPILVTPNAGRGSDIDTFISDWFDSTRIKTRWLETKTVGRHSIHSATPSSFKQKILSTDFHETFTIHSCYAVSLHVTPAWAINRPAINRRRSRVDNVMTWKINIRNTDAIMSLTDTLPYSKWNGSNSYVLDFHIANNINYMRRYKPPLWQMNRRVVFFFFLTTLESVTTIISLKNI